jgi:hypothetical protein
MKILKYINILYNEFRLSYTIKISKMVKGIFHIKAMIIHELYLDTLF